MAGKQALRCAISGGLLALVAVGVPLGAAPGYAQTACSDGAAEVVTTYTDARGITVTTTENYRGVTGLTLLVEENTGSRMENLTIPAWLQDAYGGNSAAIHLDLERGLLQRRGPCQ